MTTSSLTSGLPTLVLSGFFGRGNCGDEAILQAQYERFSPRFHLIISTDHQDAYDGFWNWYPYDRCRIIHTSNLNILQESGVVGLHVGGGGLPHGFNAAQVIHARSANKKVCLSGVDTPPTTGNRATHAMQAYYGLFDSISVRTQAAYEQMRAFSPLCRQGSDWARALPTDGSSPPPRGNRVLLVLRERPPEALPSGYCHEVERLIGHLSEQYSEVVLLPFCPEDERFLERIPATKDLPREIHWWNPRRVQYLIASAALVVSVGRLHPMIFSANVQTPAVFVEPLHPLRKERITVKARHMCRQHQWPYYSCLSDLNAVLKRQPSFHPLCHRPDTRSRWEAMACEIEQTLLASNP